MCGIIGFSGNKTETTSGVFDIDKINYLLYYNSVERTSKDSCGFYHKGLKDPVKFILQASDVIKSEAYKKRIEASSVFIGHVRSKSVGHVSLANTHPYRVNNLIGCHNGTIHNIEDVCKKYDVHYSSSRTDSYNLLRCLAKVKTPEPFIHLWGSATILFTDLLNDDLLYIYVKDRPLFRGTSLEGMYISSEEGALSAIRCTDITQFEENTFYIIEHGVVLSEDVLPTASAVTTKTFSGTLQDKWIQASVYDTQHNIIKGEWYLVDCATYGNGSFMNFGLKAGRINQSPFMLSAKNKQLHVPSKLFDLTYDYNYNDVHIDHKLMTSMFDIKLKGDGELGIAKGNIVIAMNYYSTEKKFRVYNPITDLFITGVDTSDLRVSTKEEEREFEEFMSMFKDQTFEPEVIEKVKFSSKIIDKATILSKFNSTLHKELEDARTLIKEHSGTSKTLKPLVLSSLDKVITSIEQLELNETN